MELDDLRTQIDKVDNQLHDLLMERAEIVLEIGKYKAKSTQPIFSPRSANENLAQADCQASGKLSKGSFAAFVDGNDGGFYPYARRL